METVSLSRQLGLDETRTQVLDFSAPWPDMEEMPWRRRQRELDAESARLAGQAEQLLGSPDAVGVLRGLGLALLSIRAELAAEDSYREH